MVVARNQRATVLAAATNPAEPQTHGLELDISLRALRRNIGLTIEAVGRVPNWRKINQMVTDTARTSFICDPEGRIVMKRGDLVQAFAVPRASNPARDGWRQR